MPYRILGKNLVHDRVENRCLNTMPKERDGQPIGEVAYRSRVRILDVVDGVACGFFNRKKAEVRSLSNKTVFLQLGYIAGVETLLT